MKERVKISKELNITAMHSHFRKREKLGAELHGDRGTRVGWDPLGREVALPRHPVSGVLKQVNDPCCEVGGFRQ